MTAPVVVDRDRDRDRAVICDETGVAIAFADQVEPGMRAELELLKLLNRIGRRGDRFTNA